MFFKTFLRQSGLDGHLGELPTEEKNFSKWKEILTAYFASKTFEDLNFLFENEDSCLTPVKTMEEVSKDPVLRERGMILDKKHPEYGDYFQFGAPFRFPQPRLHIGWILQIMGNIIRRFTDLSDILWKKSKR